MKHKVVSLCLAAILVMLPGCGGKNAADTSGQAGQEATGVESTSEESIVSENATEDNTETKQESVAVEEDEFWKAKEVTLPTFGDVTVREESVEGLLNVKVGTSPFSYQVDEIKAALQANSFIAEHYELSKAKSERIEAFKTYAEGDFHDYVYNEIINGRNKEDGTIDFRVVFKTDYSNFDNVNYINVYLNDMEQKSDSQEKMFSVLKDVFGEEIADYLTYMAPEEDLPGGERYNMTAEACSAGGNCYYLKRKLEKNRGEIPTWTMNFSVECSEIGFYNSFQEYDGNVEPMLHSSKYNMSRLTEGAVSNADLHNFSKLFSEFTNVNVGGTVVRTSLGSVSYSEEVFADGMVEYKLDIYELCSLLQDVEGYKQPELDVYYTIREKDDNIDSLKVEFDVEQVYRHADPLDKQKTLNAMVDQASVLMPSVDLSSVSYVEGTDSYKVEGTYTYMGVECTYNLKFSLNQKDGSWSADIIK